MKDRAWEKNVTRFVSENRNKPFEWGINDCTTFVITCIEKMLGYEVEKPDFIYSDRKGAIVFARKFSLMDGMKEQLNAYSIKENYQTIGDIILIYENEFFPSSHICLGSLSAACFPDMGVKIFPTGVLINSGFRTDILRFD